MPESRLSRIQNDVLVTLAGVEPPWTLTGGAALAGFHCGHRTTRDLDLFWHAREDLGPTSDEVARVLADAGFHVESLQTTPAFRRLKVTRGGDSVVVDLIAEPVPVVMPAVTADIGGVTIRLDHPQEILVNKLCALLQRSELRDLIDVRELVDLGMDLEAALTEAPRKDGGFSPLTLAALLKDLPIESIARVSQDIVDVPGLVAFRDQLVERLTRESAPQ